MKENAYLSHESHQDFIASSFLTEKCGLRSLKFSTVKRTMKNGAEVRLLHIEGVGPAGLIADADFWPAKCQTKSDLAKIPEKLEDVRLRFGFYIDKATGEVIEGKRPTFLGYYLNGEFIRFSGNKPVWNEDAQESIWTNEEPKPETKTEDEPEKAEDAESDAE